eukprot:INCI5138.2.p1 GENE.INCI5138.2~~INCI5138.2.p1  ORF type:complete len:1626 (+),score=319.45 INCI5138.2:225-5102(+)
MDAVEAVKSVGGPVPENAPTASGTDNEVSSQSNSSPENAAGVLAETAAKHSLPVVVWSTVVLVLLLWYISLVPVVWSLLIAAAQLVLFVLSTIGGYYLWTLVQNLFVERELLVNEIERQHDMQAKMEAFVVPSISRDKLPDVDPKSIESVLRDWNIAPEITRGGSKILSYIIRDFISTWYTQFISEDDEFPKATAIVMINAVGKFSNRLRLCATTEYKRLWILDAIIKILSKKFNWYRTMRNNAEEAHPELFRDFRSLKPGDAGTAHFFARLEKVKKAVIDQYKQKKYLHHICAEEVPDGKGGFTEDTTRRVEYFRHIVMRIMRLLLESSELECDTGFALVREVMACKVFPFLPNVVGSRNLNGWIHTALKKLEARRNATKHGSKHSAAANGQNDGKNHTDSAAIVDETDAAEGEEEDENWDDEISGDDSVQVSQPPVVSCLLPEDVDLFFSSKLADLVRRTADNARREAASALSFAGVKTSKKEAIGALEGESSGSFLLRIVDTHYLAVSVVCDNSEDIRHFLVRAVAGQGFQVEEPAQSVVHQTLLSMLQSLNAPLYQLIREHRPITVPVPAEGARETVATRVGVAAQEDEDHAPRTPPTSHVHSHFRLTRAQLLSLNSVHKKWAGGQSWIVHIPFQVAQDRQSSTASVAGTASVGKESNALAGNTPSGDNSKPENEPKEYSMLLSDDDGDRETLSSRANPRDLLDTLKAHVDEALPLSFERSAEKGIDLNSALGNALAASIHAILQDAMVVTLEDGRVDGSVDGMGLLVSGDGTDTDTPNGPVVTHAVLFDSDLARAVVDHHRKNESLQVDEAVSIHLIARSIRDKDGATRRVFEQGRSRLSSDFSTTNRWTEAGGDFAPLCKEFLEQLEMIDGALMCHYTAPKLLTEKLRALKDTEKFGTGCDDDLLKPTLLRNTSLSGAIPDGGTTSSAASTPAFRSVPPSPEKLAAVTGFELNADANTKLESANDVGDMMKEAELRQLRISPSTRELLRDPESASRRASLAPVEADGEGSDDGTGSDDDLDEFDTLEGACQCSQLVEATQAAVEASISKFLERTVPLSEIDAHRLVLIIEKVLLHKYRGFRMDLGAWLHAVFKKYQPESVAEVPTLLEEAMTAGQDKVILDIALRFPGVETPAQLSLQKLGASNHSSANASSRFLLSSSSQIASSASAKSGTAALRSFYQLGSASARWQRIYAYLHSSSLDEHFAAFLADESLFVSQHFDAGAIMLSPEHIQSVQTLFEMTRGVQFSDQTDVITEANGARASDDNSRGGSKNNNGEMLYIPIPLGRKSGDRIVHVTPDGHRLELRVPKGKKGGDTILCLYTAQKKRKKKKKRTRNKKTTAIKRQGSVGTQLRASGRPSDTVSKGPGSNGDGANGNDRRRTGSVPTPSSRRRALRDPGLEWRQSEMMEQLAAGGAGSKLTAVVVGHRTVVDPRLDLAEPYTVYVIQVSTRDAHGSKLQTWQVQRRYQYFRNLYQVLKAVQPKLRVECPKQHTFRRVFGGDQFVKHRMKELNKFLVDILDDPTLREAYHRRPILEFLARDYRRKRRTRLRPGTAGVGTQSTIDQTRRDPRFTDNQHRDSTLGDGTNSSRAGGIHDVAAGGLDHDEYGEADTTPKNSSRTDQ